MSRVYVRETVDGVATLHHVAARSAMYMQVDETGNDQVSLRPAWLGACIRSRSRRTDRCDALVEIKRSGYPSLRREYLARHRVDARRRYCTDLVNSATNS